MCPFYEGGTLEAQETQAQAGFFFSWIRLSGKRESGAPASPYRTQKSLESVVTSHQEPWLAVCDTHMPPSPHGMHIQCGWKEP